MTKMRCKMVAGVVITKDWGVGGKTYDVDLRPVTSAEGNEENTKFWEATPSGILELTGLKNRPLVEPGKEYYVDVILAGPVN